MSFATLKKNSNSSFEKLTRELEKVASSEKNTGDDRLWKPELDKSGNGYAVIRFLPPPEGEELPWAKVFSHAFQGPGGWYIENSLTTIGKSDPVGDLNRKLWNSGRDSDKEIARKQKRKLSYFSNIYVVRDSLHPENEGRVFLFKYGKKIFDKVMEAMQPEFEDETPINPFDFWQGANFKLKIVKKDGYWNYDKSEFDKVSPLLEDEDALEAIWNKEYSLTAITAADQFKSYDDLKKRLDYVLGAKPPTRRVYDEELEDESEGRGSYEVAEKTVTRAVSNPPVTRSVDSDEDNALSYFQKLAEE